MAPEQALLPEGLNDKVDKLEELVYQLNSDVYEFRNSEDKWDKIRIMFHNLLFFLAFSIVILYLIFSRSKDAELEKTAVENGLQQCVWKDKDGYHSTSYWTKDCPKSTLVIEKEQVNIVQ